MPQFVLSKVSGNKVDLATAAKKFRENPNTDKSLIGLDDGALVAAVASRYPDEYEMVAPADPAPPKAQIPSKLNPNRKSLEQMESENAGLPMSGVVLNTVGTTLGNAWQGAKDLPLNVASGVGTFIRKGIDTAGNLMTGNAPPPKDYVGLVRMARELNSMDQNSEDYAVKFNEYMQKAKDLNQPSAVDMLSEQVKQYKQKYAGPDGIVRSVKRAVVETPFETAGDVSTVATGVAGLARGTAAVAGARGPSFIGPPTKAAQTVQRVTEPIAKGALAVATATDPVSMVPNIARVAIPQKAKDAVAKKIYGVAARIPDVNLERIDRALAAGIKDSGPNFTQGNEIGWTQKQRNKLRTLFGDPEVFDSLERFEKEAIQPKVQQYNQELQRMKAQGITYDAQTLIDDSLKELKADLSVRGTEAYNAIRSKADKWAAEKGLVTYDPVTKQNVWAQLDPVEMAEFKNHINRSLKEQLDKAATDYRGRPLIDQNERHVMVLDNALRQEMVRKLNDQFSSPVLAELANELTSRIRLKDAALDRRFGRSGKSDKMLNLAPSELSGMLGAATGGANWIYNLGKTGIVALNNFGSPMAAKLAKYIARDPQLFTLGKAMFRGAGYQVSSMGDIQRIANGEAEKLRVASGVKEPIYQQEDPELTGTAPPPPARPKMKASDIPEHPPE
jgi:hypothetical protein